MMAILKSATRNEDMMFYQKIIRPLLFLRWKDPESAHERVLELMETAQLSPRTLALIAWLCRVEDPLLVRKVGNLTFPNPIGIAAGFDKDARVVEMLQAIGFGFIETGTFTPEWQAGNPRPRIWRDPAKRELRNRMGFPGNGAAAGVSKFRDIRKRGLVTIPVGANIGKQKNTPLKNAAADYCTCIRQLIRVVDYFTINVSSPNTTELRSLQKADNLYAILITCMPEVRRHEILTGEKRDVWVKISPDLENELVRDVVRLCLEMGVSAIVATNTTKAQVPSRPDLQCGKSGPPLFPLALEKVSLCHETSEGKLPVVAVGGIDSVGKLMAMSGAGATLFQFYTGMIYEGPLLARTLNRGLLRQSL
jgi:dihydroorotate dehydrogenase